LLKTPEGHNDLIEVEAIAIIPEGRRAVSGSDDNILKSWDLENDKIIASFLLFKGNGVIRSCTFGLNGSMIIACESTGRLHFLRLENDY
jgi:WD40 repeat protein